jgi:hypothetical protein
MSIPNLQEEDKLAIILAGTDLDEEAHGHKHQLGWQELDASAALITERAALTYFDKYRRQQNEY